MTTAAAETISLGGRDARIHGNPADPYFQNAQANADGLLPLARLVERHVPPDGLLLDVGANIGLSCLALAQVRPAARIVAFEPSPINAALLRTNLSLNGVTNVQVVEAAVADRTGALRFLHSGAWSHVVGQDHLAPDWPAVEVPVTTLDAATAGMGRVAFAKIDTEGHEPNVLAGGRTMLERDRPLLLVEFNAWCLTALGGISPAAFARAIWDTFEVSRVDGDGGLSPGPSTPMEFLQANLTQHGCVDDVVLRLGEGARIPSLERMSLPATAVAELDALRAEINALRASTSWKVTEPLRRAGAALKARRGDRRAP